MEFLLLFVLNIFIGALIYLLLSLKIERTSSTFQEQKLKKEMGEIITEFNATAERNITLLERKIEVLKRLLGQTGSIKSMDITLDNAPGEDIGAIKTEGKNPARNKDVSTGVDSAKTARRDSSIIVKKARDHGESGGLSGIIDKMQIFSKESEHASGDAIPVVKKVKDPGRKVNDTVSPVIKQSVEGADTFSAPGSRIDLRSDEEIEIAPATIDPDVEYIDIAELFLSTENKYNLIADLHGRGYSIEELSEYSGIPSGEIKLVISLNN